MLSYMTGRFLQWVWRDVFLWLVSVHVLPPQQHLDLSLGAGDECHTQIFYAKQASTRADH
jgi:hypothetical protein